MSGKKVDQKEYLKKYLSGDVGHTKKKKKKKKEKPFGKSTVTIVDDDFDISKLAAATEEELDNYVAGEDLPQIAGIIDERPPEVIARESGKWKSIAENESRFESDSRNAKQSKQLNVSSYRNREQLSHENRGSSDASPRRHSKKCTDVSSPNRSKACSKRSPEWRSRKSVDLSPRRKSGRDSDASPPRRSRRGSSNGPLKRKLKKSVDLSPRAKPKKDTDASPPRKSRRSRDLSPKQKAKRSSSVSPRRYSRKNDDISPLHRSPSRKLRKESNSKNSRWNSKDTATRDSNQTKYHSPATKTATNESNSPPRAITRNEDSSPPRRRKISPEHYGKGTERRNIALHRRSKCGSDTSPRQRRPSRERSPRPLIRKGAERRTTPESPPPPPTHKKMIKTLEGKVAGLQDAKSLREENEKLKRHEEKMFKQMAEKYKDEDSQTVRDRKTGKRRNVYENIEKEREKLKKEEERKKTYSRWGAGLKQIEDFKERIASETHEMGKAVARYADDKDLEDHLRNQCRDGDPMAEYFRKKQKENAAGPSVPVYQGAFPENRFNIRPGYRWDGVDRSNGYEKKWFDVQSKQKATDEEAYKYSVEDM